MKFIAMVLIVLGLILAINKMMGLMDGIPYNSTYFLQSVVIFIMGICMVVGGALWLQKIKK